MVGSRLFTSSLTVAVLGVLATAAPSRKPAQYVAFSSLPPLTGQASAPVTVIPQKPDFGFTITGRDMDTWRSSDHSVTQVADARLACVKSAEQLPTSGPQLHGISDDNVTTWDLTASTGSADRNAAKGERNKPPEVYLNTYVVYNKAGRNDPKQDDAPIVFTQTIIIPRHQVTMGHYASTMLRNTEPIATTQPTLRDIALYNLRFPNIASVVGLRVGASEALRHDMEKRLTETQKTDLQNGEYVAFTIGSLPPDLQKKALHYVQVCDAVNSPAPVAAENAPKPPRWQDYQIRFLPASAGVNYRILGIVSVDKFGDRVYF